ncbi:MAG: ArsR/SmtB family transcription factor [Promethearchaeota archaeon]
MIKITENLTEFLKILADTTRLEILEFLRTEPGEKKKREKSAGEIENGLKKSQSTISQQLKVLVKAKLINVRRESRNKFYKIRDSDIFKILDNVNDFLFNIDKKEFSEKMKEFSEKDILDTLY